MTEHLSSLERERLWTLIKPIGTAMMTTWDGEHLHSRPMRHVNQQFDDATLLYFTNLQSGKVAELATSAQVNLAYSDTDKQNYVSLSGRAVIEHNQQTIDDHWNSFVAAWFPEGKESDQVGLIRVHVEQAEYWDATQNRMVMLFEVAKANVTDKQPDLGEHRKLG